MKITIYQKPTCSTCRQVFNALKESGVEMESVNYYIEPLSKAKLTELVKKMGIQASELLRSKEEIYKKLKLVEKEVSEAEAIDLMIKYPELMQRPIVEKGFNFILTAPTEKLKE